jgi:septum formation protein
LGIAHQLLLPDADEDVEALEQVQANELPQAYVQRVTRLKLEAALARLARRKLPVAPVLCADTTVALGRDILGKPLDASDAAYMLGRLAGRTHRVLTAVSIGFNTHRLHTIAISRVSFAAMRAQDIADYVASAEPMGKAGAYAIQGLAAAYIARISGSYSGVMGLPLYETSQLLKELVEMKAHG